AEKIAEEVRPAVQERPGGRTASDARRRADGDQRINEFVTFIGTLVDKESGNYLQGRQPPGEIQVHAPQEFAVGRKGRRRHTVLAHFAEDLSVNKIVPGDLAGRGELADRDTTGGSPNQHLNPLSEPLAKRFDRTMHSKACQ